MSDIDNWIYFDGPEPDHIRPLLDALRDLSPATPEDKERLSRRFLTRLDAALSERSESPTTGKPPPPEARPPEVRPPEARPPEARPPEGPPPEVLTSMAVALDLTAEVQEALRGLPFKAPEPGTEFGTTMQVPVMDPRKGETAGLGDDSITKAVAALPFAGNMVGQSKVPIPRLPLEAYASLRAELSVWPERSADILPQYHVMNEAARRALDEHWQTQLEASPELRAKFEKALGDYTAWLRTRRF